VFLHDRGNFHFLGFSHNNLIGVKNLPSGRRRRLYFTPHSFFLPFIFFEMNGRSAIARTHGTKP